MLSVLGVAVALAVCEAAAVLTSTAGLCTRHWRPNRRPKKLDGGDLGLPPPRPNENNTVKTVPVKAISVEAIPVEAIPVTGSENVVGIRGGASGGAGGGGGGGKGGNAGGGGGGGGGTLFELGPDGGDGPVGEKPAYHSGDHGYHGGGYGHGYGGGDYGHGYGGGGWGNSGGDGGGGDGWD